MSIGEEQVCDANTERAGEPLKMLQRWVSSPDFDLCDVGPLGIGLLREPLLAPALATSQFPHAFAECDGRRVSRRRARLRHARIVEASTKRDNTLIVTMSAYPMVESP